MEFHLFLYVVNWIILFLRWEESKFHLKAIDTIAQEHKIWLPHYFTKDGIPSLPLCCKLDTSFSQMGRVKILSKGCSYNNPRTQDGIIWLSHYFTKD